MPQHRVEFPPCVQWITIEFDPSSGTAQPEDYLLISIPKQSSMLTNNVTFDRSQYDDHDNVDGNNSFDTDNSGICKNARLTTSFDSFAMNRKSGIDDEEWHVAQMFNK